MTKVKFFEDFHCFEYHSRRRGPQRFRYYLYSPVYEVIPLVSSSATWWEYPNEKTVFSSDFIPSRVAHESDPGNEKKLRDA
jgi:hypothetical protein